jgi:hypothetical protein
MHRSNLRSDSIASSKASSVGGIVGEVRRPLCHYQGETNGSDGKALRAIKTASPEIVIRRSISLKPTLA